MWFIGVEVEQETSVPPPKKILDSPLDSGSSYYIRIVIAILCLRECKNHGLFPIKKLDPDIKVDTICVI